MNSELLSKESTLFCTFVIAQLISKSPRLIKRQLNYCFLGQTLLFFYWKQGTWEILFVIIYFERIDDEIPHIQVLNMQLSEKQNRVESEKQFPQQQPVIPSIIKAIPE
ncbi:unnamed protein product [Paramecium octaurelia]|uniref:Uncharacterized protein n=1 Tax=Paramecium octaurelia TaxID=43137 RepID=A0A8S1WEZ4_PAROT|nr:unnamed protein product [Paramecium octaurelia]